MLATESSSPFQHFETADIEIEGRRFPARWQATRPPTNGRLRQFELPKGHEQLPFAVADAIASRLEWKAVSVDTADAEQLVTAYVDSLSDLSSFRFGVFILLLHSSWANVEFRHGSGFTDAATKQTAMEKLHGKLSALLEKRMESWPEPENALNARLVSGRSDELWKHLDLALKKAVAEFSRHFFELLVNLVDEELIGLVEWLPNNCCSYHFFRRVEIQTNDVESTRVEFIFVTPKECGLETVRQSGDRRAERRQGRLQKSYRFARHQHDVMKAMHSSVRNSRVIMPPAAEQVCEYIPDWLEPFVQVINGTLFRELIVERDVEVSDWGDVELIDEPIVGPEAAIVFGGFVLTDWGPKESAGEQVRREYLRRAKRFATSNRTFEITLMVTILATLCTFASGFMPIEDGWRITALLSVLVLASCWRISFDYAALCHSYDPHRFANFVAISTTLPLGCWVWVGTGTFQPLGAVIASALALLWFVGVVISWRGCPRILSKDFRARGQSDDWL
jgi:hypothetical protein